jgi:ABC-type nickel/cobalt efflux system permease component RcnA
MTSIQLCLLAAVVCGHPVPKDTHDRTIVVRLQKGDAENRIRVRVEYRLEVDETTVYASDMKPYKDEVNPFDYRGEPLRYYAEFTRIYAPILGERLSVRVNGKPIEPFRCVSRKSFLEDENGKGLGHLRCDFVFESGFDITPGQATQFEFRDQTYLLEDGFITLSLVNDSGLSIVSLVAPDDALRTRVQDGQESQHDDRLREIKAELATGSAAAPKKNVQPPVIPEPVREVRETHDEGFGLEKLLFQSNYGFFLTLLLAFVFGAAHALTPGHGKTLVAAYLVGERGTIWHALYLGLITTLTHTGSVMILAIVVALLPDEQQRAAQAWLVKGLGLIMGLMVIGIGVWLLLQRLAGRADHVHLGAGHHHHHHGEEPPKAPPPSGSLSWWGLTLLGVTGGMVPCIDAIVLFLYAIGKGVFWLVLPAVVAFSAGLALVLVVIGILVVQVPRFAESRFGNGRLLRALPILSAVIVTLMGLWLCFESVRGH